MDVLYSSLEQYVRRTFCDWLEAGACLIRTSAVLCQDDDKFVPPSNNELVWSVGHADVPSMVTVTQSFSVST